MGYRSEVTILTSGEPAKLETFKQAMLLRYKNHDYFDIVEQCLDETDSGMYDNHSHWVDYEMAHYRADFHDIKWYSEAQEWFKEYEDIAEESGIAVEFMRVGEEPSDIEHIMNNEAHESGGCMLYTETRIRVSGRD